MEKVDKPLFDICPKFTCGDDVTAENVGELIKALQQLPDELPVTGTFTKGVKVNVFNINYDNIHAEINDFNK